jgi:hypothetical protein
MPREKIFPTILIVLDVAAACGYIPEGNWRMITYWLAAAILTFCVTW